MMMVFGPEWSGPDLIKVFDNMATQRKPRSAETAAKLAQAQAKRTAARHAWVSDLVQNRGEYVDSAEFREKFGNQQIADAVRYSDRERLDCKVNENGTRMNPEEELAFVQLKGFGITKDLKARLAAYMEAQEAEAEEADATEEVDEATA